MYSTTKLKCQNGQGGEDGHSICLAGGVNEGSDANASLQQLVVLGHCLFRLQHMHLQAYAQVRLDEAQM